MAIVFEHAFAPTPPPTDIELVTLFDDPPRVLRPAGHPPAALAVIDALHDVARRHTP